MFIGYPRSGHSLVGSLLDAHENILIAHEANVLERIDEPISREDIYLELWENSWQQAENTRQETGYSYAVNGQLQGDVTELRVIGDKKGGRSSAQIDQRPELIDILRQKLGDHRLRLLHVTRHPLDNITTIHTRASENPKRPGQTLPAAIDFYFQRCDAVAKIRARLGSDVFDLRLEDLVEEPKRVLSDCCAFLGVPAGDDYLEACSKIVFGKPNQTRGKVDWPEERLREVEERMRAYDFLARY
jgi:hypothetical protein